LVKAIKSVGGGKESKVKSVSYSNNVSKNTGLYVCYDKKILNGNYVSYIGCSRESVSCAKVNKYHFGKYPNSINAQKALHRCMANRPKFVDKQGVSSIEKSYSQMNCDELWYYRNKIFADNGYCFKSPKSIRVFGRRCFSPYGRISNYEKKRVNTIKKWERIKGCR